MTKKQIHRAMFAHQEAIHETHLKHINILCKAVEDFCDKMCFSYYDYIGRNGFRGIKEEHRKWASTGSVGHRASFEIDTNRLPKYLGKKLDEVLEIVNHLNNYPAIRDSGHIYEPEEFKRLKEKK